MFEIGRVCIKIAGRDAGKKCVIVDQSEGNYFLIDGETRRRKCNLTHLEPLSSLIKIKKGASREDVKKAFKSELGIELKDTKPKEKKERPKKQRKVKKKESTESQKDKVKKDLKAKPDKKKALKEVKETKEKDKK